MKVSTHKSLLLITRTISGLVHDWKTAEKVIVVKKNTDSRLRFAQ